MRRHSIRWRLTLSYAAVALLAALALGAVLLTTLRSYYRQFEIAYLRNTAASLTLNLAEAIKAGVPLDPQVQGLSFVLQTRVRLLSPDKQVLADSGIPQKTDIAVSGGNFSAAPVPDQSGQDRFTIIAIARNPLTGTETLPLPQPLLDNITAQPLPDNITAANPDALKKSAGVFYAAVKVGSSPFGLVVNGDAVDQSGGRSDQIVNQALIDSTGTLRGSIELSDGPAYGQEIVNSVARGWMIASVIAMVLAALAGWLLSRHISRPIVALTNVTTRMAEGDLSTRANMARADEIGVLAQSFNEMADQVEETITTLRRFVSDAAHELHSPLTALQTDLELSVTEQDETRRNELIERAQQQTIRLRELADNLLDLSRVEAAGAQPSYVKLNLNDLLCDIGEPYASQADQAGLTLSLDVPQDPIEIRGDTAQIRRAIGNLIDNAIKFTPEGGTITIGLRKIAGAIELCIQDTGIGIPEEDLPQLFSRFHRSRNVANYPGNGLGLAIVKAIVEAHGGSVSAVNTSPGARFCITMPEAR